MDERTRNVSCSGSVLVLLENYFNVLFCVLGPNLASCSRSVLFSRGFITMI